MAYNVVVVAFESRFRNNSLLAREAPLAGLQVRPRPADSVVSGGGNPNIDFICHSSAHPCHLDYNGAGLSSQNPREHSLLQFGGERKKVPNQSGENGK